MSPDEQQILEMQSTVGQQLSEKGGQGGQGGCHLEGLVCVEVQRQAAVGEEEVQPAKIEEIIAAALLGKSLKRSWVQHRVEQHYLQAPDGYKNSSSMCPFP